MKRLLPAALVVFAACDSTPTETPPNPDPGPTTLATIRTATDAYHDVNRALAAGYAEASPCVASPDGGMGFHYMNNGFLDGTVDPAAPEMLLFEPQPGGGLALVGVEFMVPAADWGGSAPPRLDNIAFSSHLTPETQHGIPFPHYDLHVWSWRDNPSGMYAPFNPDVSCEAAG